MVLAVVLHSYRYVIIGNVCCCVCRNWDAFVLLIIRPSEVIETCWSIYLYMLYFGLTSSYKGDSARFSLKTSLFLPTFSLFCIQLWSWERLHVGRPDFGQPHADLAPPPAQALHDAEVDVGGGDLPGHPPAKPEVQLALPLGCRWRVPLTRVHNPSGVLLLYRDQLDAQTPDQVMLM